MCKIDGGYRPAEGDIRHMAETAGLIPEGRHILVEIQQLAEYVDGLISAALQCRWIPCQSRSRECSPFVERFIEDELNFALNPCDLRIQIGRQNAGRIGVICRGCRRSGFGPAAVGSRTVAYAKDAEHSC